MDWNKEAGILKRDRGEEAIQPALWGRCNPWDEGNRGKNSYLMSKNGQGILFVGDTGYIRASRPNVSGKRSLIYDSDSLGNFFLPHEPTEEPLERLKGEAKRLGIGRSGYHSKRGESFSVPELILFSFQNAKGIKKKEFARIGVF